MTAADAAASVLWAEVEACLPAVVRPAPQPQRAARGRASGVAPAARDGAAPPLPSQQQQQQQQQQQPSRSERSARPHLALTRAPRLVLAPWMRRGHSSEAARARRRGRSAGGAAAGAEGRAALRLAWVRRCAALAGGCRLPALMLLASCLARLSGWAVTGQPGAAAEEEESVDALRALATAVVSRCAGVVHSVVAGAHGCWMRLAERRRDPLCVRRRSLALVSCMSPGQLTLVASCLARALPVLLAGEGDGAADLRRGARALVRRLEEQWELRSAAVQRGQGARMRTVVLRLKRLLS